ncbi:MAG TPA: DUF2911 domain-containing protein [Candidatus Eisenbacteria bacterium]|nr:DUF2911 domain-containing protein [Candidatus Eisenbacteria bacterium]
MNPVRPLFVVLLSMLAAGAALAADSGNFVTRLGADTTGVEHYSRTPDRIEIDQVGRSPRVLNRHIVIDRAGAGVKHMSYVVTAPGAAAGSPPFQTIEANFTADSVMIDIAQGGHENHIHAAVPPNTLVMPGVSPWPVLEIETMKFVAQKADSIHDALYGLGAPTVGWVSVHRVSHDEVEVDTDNNVWRARVDRKGMVLGATPLRGTGKFGVERVASLDLAASTAAFAAAEKAGGAMGAFSPRDTVRATAAGASLWIDYGRPAKRGRVVFGQVVPWGEVWRTGANAATQFKTDKTLVMNGITVPPGFYTLWTLPTPQGWKLIVNSETGQWGTEYKPAKDLYTIPMTVSTLPQAVERFTIGIEPADKGGALNLDWDTTRATVAFTVQP